ncbi:hypothetical protein [Arenibacter troitsensis]|uniref:Uncharacterized protein n=1 Tax=Arenibacter troitsensis TaxID=188872 RepID=A0A1X7KU62_9FLAO|nr:hypothetical protein [Arenibacter troitsensis]SMG44775.1 hypothetical protein SAMN03080602_03354 [Arenibacter troitsensis]
MIKLFFNRKPGEYRRVFLFWILPESVNEHIIRIREKYMDYNFASKIQCIGIAIDIVFHNGYGADNNLGISPTGY